MSENTLPPFRADHVGSLLRPAALTQARADFKAGTIDADALRAAEDEAIRGAIALQHDVGLKAATDGEFRRHSWHMDFILQLGGISEGGGEARTCSSRTRRARRYAPPAMAIDGKITLRDTIFKDAFAFLRDKRRRPAEDHDPVAEHGPLPRRQLLDRQLGLPRPGPVLDDLGAYAQELQGLYDLGARYIQLDDTSLAYVNDPAQRKHIADIGGDPEHLHEQYIANMNRSLAGKPDDLRSPPTSAAATTSRCGPAEGGYDFVAEALFGELDVDGYFLEFDDERSGGSSRCATCPRASTSCSAS